MDTPMVRVTGFEPAASRLRPAGRRAADQNAPSAQRPLVLGADTKNRAPASSSKCSVVRVTGFEPAAS